MIKLSLPKRPPSGREWTDEDWKQFSRWYTFKLIVAFSVFFGSIGIGILCALSTPAHWPWYVKVLMAVTTAGVIFWFATIIEDNINYNLRKKVQAEEKQRQRLHAREKMTVAGKATS